MTLKEAIDILKRAGVDSPEHDARELFLKFATLPVTEPLTLRSKSDSPALCGAIRRRAEREPLQYIIGSVGFYREEYEVSPDCLIPRSDTELLVDYAVKHIPSGECFADVCCGSGCIGISTLANTSNTRCVSVDISDGALEITKKNAKKNNVADRLTVLKKDVISERLELPQGIYAILSNPPYIPISVYEQLEEEIFREPRIAFVAGEDGALFYERLIPVFLESLADGGFIALEIGYDQADLLRALAKKSLCTCEILKDLCGNDRVAVLRKFTEGTPVA